MQWIAARKSTACEANLGTKTEVSHGGRRGPRGALELGDSLTWEFFLGRKINPRRNAETGPSSWDTSVFVPESSRIAALIALGRRLRFSFSRCRLSESRAAEAFPFPFSLLPFLFSHSRLNCKPIASQARPLFQRSTSWKCSGEGQSSRMRFTLVQSDLIEHEPFPKDGTIAS